MSTPNNKKRKHFDSNQPINYVNRQSLKSQSHTNTTGHGTAVIKKQIRDIKRLLERNTKLPDTVVKTKQTELKKLEQQLLTVQESKLQQQYKQKYKEIKFHDWVKTNRRYQKVLKQLRMLQIDNSDTMSETEYQLRQQLHSIELDLQYIQHYPKNIKYLSLYANTGDKQLIRASNIVAENNAKIAEIRAQIAKTLQMQSLNTESIETKLNIPRTLVSKTHIPNEDFVNKKNEKANGTKQQNKSDALFLSDNDSDIENIQQNDFIDNDSDDNSDSNTVQKQIDHMDNNATTDTVVDIEADTADPHTSKKAKKSKKHKKHKKSSKHSSDTE